jgi:hypothetical protein
MNHAPRHSSAVGPAGPMAPPTSIATSAVHDVSLVERGPFVAPVCTCGWSGLARRARETARREADRHAGVGADTGTVLNALVRPADTSASVSASAIGASTPGNRASSSRALP